MDHDISKKIDFQGRSLRSFYVMLTDVPSLSKNTSACTLTQARVVSEARYAKHIQPMAQFMVRVQGTTALCALSPRSTKRDTIWREPVRVDRPLTHSKRRSGNHM